MKTWQGLLIGIVAFLVGVHFYLFLQRRKDNMSIDEKLDTLTEKAEEVAETQEELQEEIEKINARKRPWIELLQAPKYRFNKWRTRMLPPIVPSAYRREGDYFYLTQENIDNVLHHYNQMISQLRNKINFLENTHK